MWEATDQDFEAIRSWGLKENPFAAVEDFSHLKTELRWENKEQMDIYNDYVKRRNEYIQNADFDEYYRRAEKPIDKRRWQYLIERKAWYIMPLGWDNIAKTGGIVADFGGGDGDTVQRLIDYTISYWKNNNIKDKTLHIIGVDLNQSRIDNAKTLVESTNENITFEFHQGDMIGSGLNYKDLYFDYSLCCGVFEILNDEQFEKFLLEMCRLTKKGLFIEDLYEKFPGGFPRNTLGKSLFENSFSTKKRHVILSEPFSTVKLQDPKKLWPSLLVQNIWAERI